jgi:hypothetical protein
MRSHIRSPARVISEERLHLLLPKELKAAVRVAAHRQGLSIGEYLRRLIEVDLKRLPPPEEPEFPFGQKPIHTGRLSGSLRSAARA